MRFACTPPAPLECVRIRAVCRRAAAGERLWLLLERSALTVLWLLSWLQLLFFLIVASMHLCDEVCNVHGCCCCCW
jgi:hypothetical protein